MSSSPGAIWVDGERLPEHGAHVSIRDRGFTLADGVFETMRLHHGVLFRREQHLGRLRQALAALQIPAPAALDSWLESAAAAAGDAEASVRLTVTRGCGPGGVAPPAAVRPTVAIAVSPWPSFAATIYERGLAAVVASGRRNPYAMTAGLKTVNYTDAVAALLEAQRRGADEGLFLDTDGHCSEATSSNLFAWTGAVLLTPPTSCAALPGITRHAVRELAATLGIACADDAFGLDVLMSAREVFLTSSLRGIAPVSAIEGVAVGEGRPGPVTTRIADAYGALIERECPLRGRVQPRQPQPQN